MRPIDADALKKLLLEERDKIPLEVVERYSFGVPTPNKHGQSMRGGIRKALRCMEETPTLDYAPVVHGEWKYYHKQNKAVCLACSFERDLDADFGRAISCPNCGARMGGKESK